jgi:hypothetical protein
VGDRFVAGGRDGSPTLNGAAFPFSAGIAFIANAGVGGPIGGSSGYTTAFASPERAARIAYRGPIFEGVAEGLTPQDLDRAIERGQAPQATPLDLIPSDAFPRNGSPGGVGGALGDGDTGVAAVASQRRANLLTDFIPFDGNSLESAIDRYLARFEDLGAGLSRFRPMSDLVVELMAVAVTLAASRLAVELFGRRPSDDEAELAGAAAGAGFDGDPGLPDPWSLGGS